MSSEKPKRKKSSVIGWIAIILVVIVFVGARQIHPGGIRGLISDFGTESSFSPEIKELSDRMLASLLPIGAAAICLKEDGENPDLKDAAANFFSRNEVAMKELVSKVEAAGGMSSSEKDLLNKEAYRNAHSFIDQGQSAEWKCKAFRTA